MTAPAAFKQADVTRLIKGAINAGCPQDAIRLTVAPDGSISLTVTRAEASNDDEPGQGWEDA